MSDQNNDNLPLIEDHHNKHSIIDTIPPLLMVLRKLEHSGFPGIYDPQGLYCVDRDGLLVVLEIHKRHKRLISPKDLHIRMISILGVDLTEAEYIALHTLLILDQ